MSQRVAGTLSSGLMSNVGRVSTSPRKIPSMQSLNDPVHALMVCVAVYLGNSDRFVFKFRRRAHSLRLHNAANDAYVHALSFGSISLQKCAIIFDVCQLRARKQRHKSLFNPSFIPNFSNFPSTISMRAEKEAKIESRGTKFRVLSVGPQASSDCFTRKQRSVGSRLGAE